MNRRDFLKNAMLGVVAATVPLAVAAPGKLSSYETLVPWQKEFVKLVKTGRNVRLSGGVWVR